MKIGSAIGEALKEAALATVAEKVEGENRSVRHLFAENGRQSLALVAGSAVASSIENERLAAIAGGVVTKRVNGQRVSKGDVLKMAFGMMFSCHKEF